MYFLKFFFNETQVRWRAAKEADFILWGEDSALECPGAEGGMSEERLGRGHLTAG